MGYVSDRLTGIMRVSDMVRKMEAEELTQKERDLLASAPTLEKRNQQFPELSAKATAIFQRAIAAVEAQDQQQSA
ncbi:MAG: hypothetical protein WCS31_12980 [Verrucomicrobiae bacterium]